MTGAELPDFVRDNIYSLPDACRAKGLTYRQLAELAQVDYAIVRGYARLEKHPANSYYNKLAKVFGWQRWVKR